VLRELDELLPLAAAIAVADAVQAGATIKWPNDVWIDGRKVAGILIEGRPQEGWAVLGIGLNVSVGEFPPPLDETATSLRLAGVDLDRDAALAAVIDSLSRWLPRPSEEILAAWRSRDALLGRTVRWSNGSEEGIAAGIDASGALVVETAGGEVTLDAGEVHLER
jgi:BirA family biotin operon repressor/biotin-[acetyl-CoA-carboxylase] ligase